LCITETISVHSNKRAPCAVTKGRDTRCGTDELSDVTGRQALRVRRQTVPDASSGDWKSSVADGRQSGAADDQ